MCTSHSYAPIHAHVVDTTPGTGQPHPQTSTRCEPPRCTGAPSACPRAHTHASTVRSRSTPQTGRRMAPWSRRRGLASRCLTTPRASPGGRGGGVVPAATPHVNVAVDVSGRRARDVGHVCRKPQQTPLLGVQVCKVHTQTCDPVPLPQQHHQRQDQPHKTSAPTCVAT